MNLPLPERVLCKPHCGTLPELDPDVARHVIAVALVWRDIHYIARIYYEQYIITSQPFSVPTFQAIAQLAHTADQELAAVLDAVLDALLPHSMSLNDALKRFGIAPPPFFTPVPKETIP